MMLDVRAVDELAGYRILVVEDEMMIAMFLEEALEALGCRVIGPVSKLSDAVRLARDEAMDAAVLDVNIRGGQVFEAAELLIARGIPFVLASGYSDWVLPEAMQGKPRLMKPFTLGDLEHKVKQLRNSAVPAALAG
jgi:DNA-binding response OmpR family regulator